MSGRPSGCYTLLADDNSSFANSDSLRDAFKAHLVYNLILNGRIAFSDNQVICSSNLQALAASDSTMIALFEQGFFDLAIRENFDAESGVAALESVHGAFLRENKIRFAAKDYQSSPGLALIERSCASIPWSYDTVRTRFTDNCERLLLREFRPLLSDSEYDRFHRIIAAEKERSSGLGRVFVEKRLHLRMRKAGIPVDKSRRALIQRCIDAPYMSNLPAAIGLNPIYAQEHRASFELMRGGGHSFETVGSVRAPSRFDHEHYVHGLCRLTIEDILFLQRLPARGTYLALSHGGLRDGRASDEAFEAFVHFNELIEDRIASRFPEIALHSPGDPDRAFYKQIARRLGAAGRDDLYAFLLGLLAPGVPSSLCKQVILDVRASLGGEAETSLGAETVQRQARKKRLDQHLRNAGLGDRLAVEDRPTSDGPFAKEIIIS